MAIVFLCFGIGTLWFFITGVFHVWWCAPRETLHVVVKWPKNIRLQRNSHVSNEVAEHLTVLPVAAFVLLDPVETLVSLLGNFAVGATLESGGRV